MTSKQRTYLERIFLFFVISVSLWWRFYKVATVPGLNGDEIYGTVHLWELFHNRSGIFTTPTGNFLPLILDGPSFLLQFIVPSQFWALRLPVAIWGVITLIAFYWIMQKITGQKRSAVLWTLLLCNHTGLVAFSRFGWSPSLLPLFSLLTIYGCWSRQWFLSLIGFILSLWLHPVAIFLAPFALLLLPPFWLKWPKIKVGLSLGGLFALFLTVISFSHAPLLPSVPDILGRLIDGEFWRYSIIAILDLASGTTAAQYTTGSEFPVTQTFLRLFLLGLTIVGAATFSLHRKEFEKKYQHRLTTLIFCWWSSWFLFALVASPQLLAMGNVRYGYFLLTPLFLRVAILFAPFCEEGKRGFWILVTAVVLQMGLTQQIYWGPLWAERGTQQHHCFVLGQEGQEAKEKLYEQLLALKDPKKQTVIITSDWWVYWPLRYLELKEQHFWIVIQGQNKNPLFPQDYEKALSMLYQGDATQYEIFKVDPVNQQSGGGTNINIITDYWNNPLYKIQKVR